MVTWRAVGLSALIAGTIGACADVWGLETLTVADGSAPTSDGGRSGPTETDSGRQSVDGGPDGGMARGTPHHVDGSAIGPSDATTSQADAEADGECNLDPTVACTDPSYVGVTCPSGAQPSGTLPNVTCTTQGTSGSNTSYCCSGNFCGDTGDPSDPPACSSCYLMYCTAPDCLCYNTGTVVDDAGDTQCDNYVFECWNQCYFSNNAPSIQQCESQCNGGLPSGVVSAGNDVINCLNNYCASPCGF
jgi:hypothetical protein